MPMAVTLFTKLFSKCRCVLYSKAAVKNKATVVENGTFRSRWTEQYFIVCIKVSTVSTVLLYNSLDRIQEGVLQNETKRRASYG